MINNYSKGKVQVLTDHRGWPVAVNEGPVWWMVAQVEPAESKESAPQDVTLPAGHFRLQLTNGQVLLAEHDVDNRRWTITCQNDEAGAENAAS